MIKFDKPFTQQQPIDDNAIAEVVDILKTGRLHRYNTIGDEISPVAKLENEYANYQGSKYCLAVSSCGYAIATALRAVGVKNGDKVLMNAWTLAPVPGAVHSVGGVPVFVEIDDDLRIDLNDLESKIKSSSAKYLLVSHMRGHLCDMDKLMSICNDNDVIVIEDCAHTMGAQYNGIKSGNFGKVACFSTQTYKHMNSGEGGFLTTNDAEISAKSIILSGSYMLFDRNGARPDTDTFEKIKLITPNCSGRMDNMRACLLLNQLKDLDNNIEQWNDRYNLINDKLQTATNIETINRGNSEKYVGSSIQFKYNGKNVDEFINECMNRGVEIKYFGHSQPHGFTSNHKSWEYTDNNQKLPKTDDILSRLCDMRIPLTFSMDDCDVIADIINQVATELS